MQSCGDDVVVRSVAGYRDATLPVKPDTMHRFLDILPAALAERCRVLHGAPLRQSGDYVLYWMHHSMRAHDNPALEVAQA